MEIKRSSRPNRDQATKCLQQRLRDGVRCIDLGIGPTGFRIPRQNAGNQESMYHATADARHSRRPLGATFRSAAQG
jgi:hypothetical protein